MIEKLFFILFLIILFFLFGCQSSYKDCMEDCRDINFDKYCLNYTYSISHLGEQIDCLNGDLRLHCYDECRK